MCCSFLQTIRILAGLQQSPYRYEFTPIQRRVRSCVWASLACQVLVCKDFARLDRPQTIREEGGLYPFTLVTVDKVLSSDPCCAAFECVLPCLNCFWQLPHVFGCSSREELLRWTSAFERCVTKDSVPAVHARCCRPRLTFCRSLSSVFTFIFAVYHACVACDLSRVEYVTESWL